MGTRTGTWTTPSAIAIDGPGASGKSTVGRLLAQRLGYRFVDTGAMYRAVTVAALNQGIPLDDAQGLAAVAAKVELRLDEAASPEAHARVLVQGREVTDRLYAPEVDRNVSRVSMLQPVREALVRIQRELARQGRIVMVGRDIGTVVLPEAPVKVYLDASVAKRARRRFEQRRNGSSSLKQVEDDLKRRDRLDSQREVSPLKAAADAHRVDTDRYSAAEVVDEIWRVLSEG